MRTPEKLTLSKSFCKQRGMSRNTGGEEQTAICNSLNGLFCVCLQFWKINKKIKKINFCGKKKKLGPRMDRQCTEKAERWKLRNWVYSGKRNLWWQKKLERLLLYKPIAGICTTAALGKIVFHAALTLSNTKEMEVLATVLSPCEMQRECSKFTHGMRTSWMSLTRVVTSHFLITYILGEAYHVPMIIQ